MFAYVHVYMSGEREEELVGRLAEGETEELETGEGAGGRERNG